MHLTLTRTKTCAGALATVLLLAVAELAADTAVYRCENAAGGIEFSQRPCAEGGEQIIIEDRLTGWTPPAGDNRQPAEQSPKPQKGAKTVRTATNRETTCWNKRNQLEQVNRKLRRGYTPAKGVELRHKRRMYEDYLSEFCR
jgi:hypothetical protein